jgi:hypothetical protein
LAEAFVTLEEAAVFEGLGYETIRKRIQRNSDLYKTKIEPRDGGKDRVLVALSSLSKKSKENI